MGLFESNNNNDKDKDKDKDNDNDYSDGDKIQKRMLWMDDCINHLVELAEDPKKYGELVTTLDPVINKVDRHIVALQDRLTEELDKRTKEFEVSLKSSDDSVIKKLSIPDFKHEMSKKLHVEKLTEQNITIRRILDKIRQVLSLDSLI